MVLQIANRVDDLLPPKEVHKALGRCRSSGKGGDLHFHAGGSKY